MVYDRDGEPFKVMCKNDLVKVSNKMFEKLFLSPF